MELLVEWGGEVNWGNGRGEFNFAICRDDGSFSCVATAPQVLVIAYSSGGHDA